MKDKTIKTLTDFTVGNMEYKPVKSAIAEELKEVISKVYQLDPETANTLGYLTEVMMNHFHEDVKRVQHKELTALELVLNGLAGRIESARLALFKEGYEDDKKHGNPMWYLSMALFDIKKINELSEKEQGAKK